MTWFAVQLSDSCCQDWLLDEKYQSGQTQVSRVGTLLIFLRRFIYDGAVF